MTRYKCTVSYVGDGYEGWIEHAPFDAILITAAVDHVPEPLIRQLKDGGRLVLPLGPSGEYQHLVEIVKSSDGLLKKKLMDVLFVPMVGEALKK